jgi:hypothetical protein
MLSLPAHSSEMTVAPPADVMGWRRGIFSIGSFARFQLTQDRTLFCRCFTRTAQPLHRLQVRRAERGGVTRLGGSVCHGRAISAHSWARGG